ncbi:hypothetical protein GXW82_21325 [Streptacidiphilus sp. 4-A2]|nr:hypothetical protein [Streptacidiphilus sp. 4-A2]
MSGDPIAFKPQPAFHDTTITPGELSYTQQTITAAGRLTTYDPNAGDTGTPWTGPVTLQLGSTDTDPVSTQAIGADGSFSLSLTPAPNAVATTPVTSELVHLQADFAPPPARCAVRRTSLFPTGPSPSRPRCPPASSWNSPLPPT